MQVQRAYKTELSLNNWQITACKRHAGAARWAYNWGLQVKQERYQAGRKSPTAYDLHRELNALKKTDVAWMYEVSKSAPQEALRNLDAAFTNFFRRCAPARSKGSGKASWATRASRPKRRDWAAFGSPAPSWSFLTPSCCLGWAGCDSRSAAICRPVA
ncbi:MAG: helix-turn-helix domain-containing protein [Ktedonobacterales bacterium]